MKIVLIAPYSTGPARGNITTVSRIRLALNELGHEATVLGADRISTLAAISDLSVNPPDIVHAFHCCIGGVLGAAIAQQLKLPLVLTATGSDFYSEKYLASDLLKNTITQAAVISCFDDSMREQIGRFFPDLAHKCVIVQQGVEKLRETGIRVINRRQNDFIVLLPAAIRREKDILLAIHAVRGIQEFCPELRLVLAGGELDHDYAEEIKMLLLETTNVEWLGDVPHHLMGDLYRDSDLIINTSQFEGGMANSLLEGLAAGKRLLLRDIPGNRAFAFAEKTSNVSFFTNTESLQQQLVISSTVRNKTGINMKLLTPRQEAEAFTLLYENIKTSYLANC